MTRLHPGCPAVAASLMVGAGVPRLVVSKILNYVETGVTAVYDRHSCDMEKRAALDFWGKRVEAIIANNRDEKVLTFRPRMSHRDPLNVPGTGVALCEGMSDADHIIPAAFIVGDPSGSSQ